VGRSASGQAAAVHNHGSCSITRTGSGLRHGRLGGADCASWRAPQRCCCCCDLSPVHHQSADHGRQWCFCNLKATMMLRPGRCARVSTTVEGCRRVATELESGGPIGHRLSPPATSSTIRQALKRPMLLLHAMVP
jgi:hypothetical protein